MSSHHPPGHMEERGLDNDRPRHAAAVHCEHSMSTPPVPPPPGALARRLGLGDAIVIGLGSMIGAGVFAASAPAAAAAGTALLAGLVVAGFIAFCNATSSAQLAAQYPTSGGSYV